MMISASTCMPSNDFTVFPRLPPELRLLVYQHAHSNFLQGIPIPIPYHPSHSSLVHTSATHKLPSDKADVNRDNNASSFSTSISPLLLTSWEACHHLQSQRRRFNIPGLVATVHTVLQSHQKPPTLSRTLDSDHATVYFPRPGHGLGYDAYLRDFTLSASHAAPPNRLKEATLDLIGSVAVDFLTEQQGRKVWEIYNISCLLERLRGLRELVLVVVAGTDGQSLSSSSPTESDIKVEDADKHVVPETPPPLSAGPTAFRQSQMSATSIKSLIDRFWEAVNAEGLPAKAMKERISARVVERT